MQATSEMFDPARGEGVGDKLERLLEELLQMEFSMERLAHQNDEMKMKQMQAIQPVLDKMFSSSGRYVGHRCFNAWKHILEMMKSEAELGKELVGKQGEGAKLEQKVRELDKIFKKEEAGNSAHQKVID